MPQILVGRGLTPCRAVTPPPTPAVIEGRLAMIEIVQCEMSAQRWQVVYGGSNHKCYSTLEMARVGGISIYKYLFFFPGARSWGGYLLGGST